MRHGPWYGPNVQKAEALKQGYTSVARNAASRSITGGTSVQTSTLGDSARSYQSYGFTT